jgi:hypothetical protein
MHIGVLIGFINVSLLTINFSLPSIVDIFFWPVS